VTEPWFLWQPSCRFIRLIVGSYLEETAPQRNGHRVRPIMGLELIHEILYVEIHGGFGNRKLVCDFLVTVAIANQAEYLYLSRRKLFFP
jgi:hypothetical protein